MLNRYLLIVLLSVACSSLHAQMDSLFRSMPEDVLPLLNEKSRKDLVDFYQNNMEAKTHNALGTYCTLLSLTDDYLLLQSSEKSRVEMKLLPMSDGSKLLAVVSTAFGPAADSFVQFYTTSWKGVNHIALPQPQVSEYWDEAPDSLAEVVRLAQLSQQELPLVEIRFAADNNEVTLTLQSQELTKEEKDAASVLQHPLRYLWTGKEFVICPKR